MNVYIITRKGYDETVILGVYTTKELAEGHIKWIIETGKGRDRIEQYDILTETVYSE